MIVCLEDGGKLKKEISCAYMIQWEIIKKLSKGE